MPFRPVAFAVAALLGGVGCLLLDHLHATHGVLWYPRPVVWGQAWWVLPLFVGATAATIGGARLVRRLLGGAAIAAPSLGAIVGDALAFATVYAATSFVQARSDIMALVFVAFWVARVAHGVRPWVIAFCVATALAGWGVEAGVQALDGFHYRHTDIGAVPYWLPTIYLYVGLLGAQLERAVSDGDR